MTELGTIIVFTERMVELGAEVRCPPSLDDGLERAQAEVLPAEDW